MAIARQPEAPPLSYEEYMAEPEILQRYDIVDGVRIYMTNPTRQHQRIAFRLGRFLDDFGNHSGLGQMIIAPCDILISRQPLRTRQPDLLFISYTQLAKCGREDDPSPLMAALELVVEILSPSETGAVREDKIADYCAIGVKECWLVSPAEKTVEALLLSREGATSVAIYRIHQSIQSVYWPDLIVPVADIFNR